MSARAEAVRARKVPKKAPHLHLVPRGKKNLVRRVGSRRYAATIATTLILGATIMFGVLLEQVVLAQTAFELSRLRTGLARAESHHEELLLEAAKLDSSTRIERYARTTLGMVDPAPGDIEYIVANVRTGATLAEVSVRRGHEHHGAASLEPASAVGADSYGAAP